MSRDVLTVDSDTLDSTVSILNRASIYLDDSISSSKNSFSYLQSSPTLSKGINTLHGNMSVMAQRLRGFGNTLNKQNNKIVETENYLDGLIDGIEIPTELANVDTSYQSERVTMDLKKNDGKSVNSNDTTTKQALDEETEIKEVQLDDINNENGKEKQELDDTHRMDKEQLVDINNDLGTEEVVLDDKHSFAKEELQELNDNATNEVVSDDNYNTNKEELQSIDNSSTLSTAELQFDELDIDKAKKIDDIFLTTQDIYATEDILNRLKGEYYESTR